MTDRERRPRSNLRRLLWRYAGFILGAFTVAATFSAFHPDTLIALDSLLISETHFPASMWWANIFLNAFVVGGVLGTVLFFGPYGFLGGLVGSCPLRHGLAICLVTSVTVFTVALAFHDLSNYASLFGVAYIGVSFAGMFTGLALAFLLGFSLRRLAFLFVYPCLRSSP
ncbi:MAG: hypothetical protein AAGK14_15760 [Verrucomicrobiota bacterium]